MTSRFRSPRLVPAGETATDRLANAGTGMVPAALAVMILITFVAPRPAFADWPLFGRAVVIAPNDQLSPAITGDGASGAIVTWVDRRDAAVNVFARRVLASGDLDPAWPIDGRALRTDPLALGDVPEDPAFPAIVSDGVGGAIVAWQEARVGSNGADIFAQHILASGAVDPAWPANGAALCVIDGVQDIPAIASDGAGGAIVTWFDSRPGASVVDVYAQHVLASGVVDPGWAVNGLAVGTAAGAQAFPTIVGDGSGGAIITWYDGRSSLTGFDIYAQHVLGSGAVDAAWPVNGRALCTAIGDQFEPKVVSDGAHGAIATWTDNREGGSTRAFTQHVLASGAVDPAWPVNGRGVASPATSEEFPTLASDGSGGAIVTWIGRVNGVANPYAQHLTATGGVDPAWPAGGRALSLADFEKRGPVIAPDGAGGAIVAWQVGVDIVAQHVLASGALNPNYPANGRVLCDLPSEQRDPAIVATGAGGAIVAWTDTRNGAGTDIFALQVAAAGTTDVPAPMPGEISFAPASPNPARESLTLRFALPREADVRIAIFDLSGRRVRELVSGTEPAGPHAVNWDLRDERGEAVSAGVYFARFDVDRRTAVQRFMRLK